MAESTVLLFSAVVTLGAIALFARSARRSWLAPSATAPLLWFFFTAIPLVFAPDYRVSATAVWVIVLLVLSLQLGAFMGEGRPIRANPATGSKKSEKDFHAFLAKRLVRWCLIFTTLGMVGAAFQTIYGLELFRLPFSLEGFSQLGPLLSIRRYLNFSDPIALRLLRPWVFPAALLGGFAYPLIRKRREQILTVIWIVPAAITGAATASRSGILLAGVAFVAGVIAVLVFQTRGTYRIFRKGPMARALIVVVGVLAIALVGQLFRWGIGSANGLVRAWDFTQPGAMGYLAALSNWLRSQGGKLGFGAYTFAGLYDLLGLHRRLLGVYGDYVDLGGPMPINIYTVFRGLISDFTLPGAIPVSFIFGFASGRAYRAACQGESRSLAFLSAFYAALVYSPIISIFVFNDLIAAWIIAAGFLVWVGGRYRAHQRKHLHFDLRAAAARPMQPRGFRPQERRGHG